MKANNQNETHTFFSKEQSDKMNKERSQRETKVKQAKKNKAKNKIGAWVGVFFFMVVMMQENEEAINEITSAKTETRTEVQIAKDEITKFSRWERRAAVKCGSWRGVTITTSKDKIQMVKECRDFEQKREWRRQAEWNMQKMNK